MKKLQEIFAKIFDQVKEHDTASRCHLLLDNVSFLSILLSEQTIEVKTKFIAFVKGALEKIDAQAADWHFRHFLAEIADKIKQNIHGDEPSSEEKNLKEDFDSFIKEVLYRDGQARVPYRRSEVKGQWNKLISEQNDPYETLRKIQQEKIANLNNDFDNNQYTVFWDITLPYVHILANEGKLVLSQLVALEKLGESLLHRVQEVPKKVQERLWHYIHTYRYFIINSLTSEHISQIFQLDSSNEFKEFIKRTWDDQSESRNPLRCMLILHYCFLKLDGKSQEHELLVEWGWFVCRLNQSMMDYKTINASPLLKDFITDLNNARCEFSNLNIVEAQKKFTAANIQLLNNFLETGGALLGSPPCHYALLALGSTSRGDRMPHSDLEFVLLYEPLQNSFNEQVQAYIFILICCFELSIIRLRGTPNFKDNQEQNAGIHIDSTTHLLKKGLFGTIENIINEHVEKILLEKQVLLDQNPSLMQNENLCYSLLRPVLINQGGERLFANYQKRIKNILAKPFPENPTLTLGQNIAINSLKDILKEAKEEIETKNSGSYIDVKKAFNKPLVFFALSLQLSFSLFDNDDARHPVDIYQAAFKHNLIDEDLTNLLCTALDVVYRLRSNLHLDKKYQEEQVILYPTTAIKSSLSDEQRLNLEVIRDCIIFPLEQKLSQFITILTTENRREFFEIFKQLLLRNYLKKRTEYQLRKANGEEKDSNPMLTLRLTPVGEYHEAIVKQQISIGKSLDKKQMEFEELKQREHGAINELNELNTELSYLERDIDYLDKDIAKLNEKIKDVLKILKEVDNKPNTNLGMGRNWRSRSTSTDYSFPLNGGSGYNIGFEEKKKEYTTLEMGKKKLEEKKEVLRAAKEVLDAKIKKKQDEIEQPQKDIKSLRGVLGIRSAVVKNDIKCIWDSNKYTLVTALDLSNTVRKGNFALSNFSKDEVSHVKDYTKEAILEGNNLDNLLVQIVQKIQAIRLENCDWTKVKFKSDQLKCLKEFLDKKGKGDLSAKLLEQSEVFKILFTNYSKITHINLSANKLGNSANKVVFDLVLKFVTFNRSLRYLNLCENYLGDKEITLLGKALAESTLESLDLSRNFITIKGFLEFSRLLKNNKNLKFIGLNENYNENYMDANAVVEKDSNGSLNLTGLEMIQFNLDNSERKVDVSQNFVRTHKSKNPSKTNVLKGSQFFISRPKPIKNFLSEENIDTPMSSNLSDNNDDDDDASQTPGCNIS